MKKITVTWGLEGTEWEEAYNANQALFKGKNSDELRKILEASSAKELEREIGDFYNYQPSKEELIENFIKKIQRNRY